MNLKKNHQTKIEAGAGDWMSLATYLKLGLVCISNVLPRKGSSHLKLFGNHGRDQNHAKCYLFIKFSGKKSEYSLSKCWYVHIQMLYKRKQRNKLVGPEAVIVSWIMLKQNVITKSIFASLTSKWGCPRILKYCMLL